MIVIGKTMMMTIISVIEVENVPDCCAGGRPIPCIVQVCTCVLSINIMCENTYTHRHSQDYGYAMVHMHVYNRYKYYSYE